MSHQNVGKKFDQPTDYNEHISSPLFAISRDFPLGRRFVTIHIVDQGVQISYGMEQQDGVHRFANELNTRIYPFVDFGQFYNLDCGYLKIRTIINSATSVGIAIPND